MSDGNGGASQEGAPPRPSVTAVSATPLGASDGPSDGDPLRPSGPSCYEPEPRPSGPSCYEPESEPEPRPSGPSCYEPSE
jgi:hypothetical protein